jgi:hypothetical protein
MRRWKVERRAVTAAAPSGSQSSELDGDAPASAVAQSESDRPIGVNADPDPGPTEASLLAAAAAEALKRDEAGILADTSIVSPPHPITPAAAAIVNDSAATAHARTHTLPPLQIPPWCWRDHPDPEARAFYGSALNRRSLEFAQAAAQRGGGMGAGRPQLELSRSSGS